MTHFWVTGDPGELLLPFILLGTNMRDGWFVFLAIDLSTFSYYLDGESVPSIQFVTHMLVGVGFNDQAAPWGTKWMGKGAQSGGWFNNL